MAAGIPDRESSSAFFNAFFGIESFRGKLEFADRYLQKRLADGPSELLSEWRSLEGRLDTASKARNKLAHWSLIGYSDGKPGKRYVLHPPAVKASNNWSKEIAKADGKVPTFALGIVDLAKWRMTFFTLVVALESIRARAANVAEPHHLNVVEFPAPRLEELRTQFRTLANKLGA